MVCIFDKRVMITFATEVVYVNMNAIHLLSYIPDIIPTNMRCAAYVTTRACWFYAVLCTEMEV